MTFLNDFPLEEFHILDNDNKRTALRDTAALTKGKNPGRCARGCRRSLLGRIMGTVVLRLVCPCTIIFMNIVALYARCPWCSALCAKCPLRHYLVRYDISRARTFQHNPSTHGLFDFQFSSKI